MSLIKIQVNTVNQKYPIYIGNNILNKLNKFLKNASINLNHCLIIADKNVPKKLIKEVIKSIPRYSTIIHYFNANEKNKNQNSVQKILSILLKKNFNRNDCLISIGGGITGDVSGFAASIYKRGLKFINIPTTLLSQVDSSIGGKTGVNTPHGKNLIGSFYQPMGVKTAAKFSLINKNLNIKDFQIIENHLNKLNLPSDINKFFSMKDLNKILSFMKKDKKNNTKKINLILLKKIGTPIHKLEFNEKRIATFLQKELIQ
jgi:3-dehydroquinate synthetase